MIITPAMSGVFYRRLEGRLVGIVALYDTGDPRVTGMIDVYGNRVLMMTEQLMVEPSSDTVH